MPRGRDSRWNGRRRPQRPFKAIRSGNVYWVNFENPGKLHPEVEAYALDQQRAAIRKAAMQEHPSVNPNTVYDWDTEQKDEDK